MISIPVPEQYKDRAFVQRHEAQLVLGMKRDTFYRHVYPAVLRGEIASMSIGRKRYIQLASLLAWAARQQKGDARWGA